MLRFLLERPIFEATLFSIASVDIDGTGTAHTVAITATLEGVTNLDPTTPCDNSAIGSSTKVVVHHYFPSAANAFDETPRWWPQLQSLRDQ
jgi:hypothetical protein